MADERCAEMELLLQADLDGELTPAEAARVGAHVPSCMHCSSVQAELLALSERVRAEVPRFELPPGLEARVRTATRSTAATRGPLTQPSPAGRGLTNSLSRLRERAGVRARLAPTVAAGFALAACLALAFLPGTPGQTGDVVDSHLRALQPGHLMDVVSSDQHTVKPWFDGRVDFAPPVKDLAAARFPLLGGRLDYVDGHPAAALVYGRDKHLIDLFIWPEAHREIPETGSRSGYNVQRWTQDGMVFWAVSDLNAKELADFARLWRAG